MTRKRKNQETDMNQDIIFNSLLNDFETTYKELLNILKQETNYKHLVRSAEVQFYNPARDCAYHMESQRARFWLAKINLLAIEVDKNIDEIISKKFNRKFHNLLKQKVLTVMLKLQSKKSSPEVVNELLQDNFDENSKDEEFAVFETLKDLSQYCAESLNNIEKQVIEMPIEEANPKSSENAQEVVPIRIKEESLDIDESSGFSFGSLSSVHTSELSSFDDNIVFSSDDECEKRMSVKAVEKRLSELRAGKLTEQKQDNSNKSEDLSQLKEESSDPQMILPQRIRKPNSKYATSDTTLSLKKTPVEKFVPLNESFSMNDPSKPKRGRPRKTSVEKVVPSTESSSMSDPAIRKWGRPRKTSDEKSMPSTESFSMNDPSKPKKGRPRKTSVEKALPSTESSSMSDRSIQKRGRPRKTSVEKGVPSAESSSMSDPPTPKRGRPKKHT